MVNSIELKVGNFVLHGDIVVKVKNILDYGINCEISEDVKITAFSRIPFNELNPIKLNDEILLKTGFDYGHNGELILSLWKKNLSKKLPIKNLCYFKGYMYLVNDSLNNSDEEQKTIIIWLSINSQLFTLHNLQNLYYSLTGEELKVSI